MPDGSIFHIYSYTRKKSLVYRFLIAQKNDYKRDDWYSEVKNILNEFGINKTDEEIKATPDSLFMELVNN